MENNANDKLRAAIEAAQQRDGEPHLRDILKREHDEMRPENPALEKWASSSELEFMGGKLPKQWESMARLNEEIIQRFNEPDREAPDMEME